MSSPITQWEESLEVALARFMARTMVDAIHEDDMDEQDFENAKQAITSATIELMTQIIGPDDDVTDLKNFNSVAEHRNALRAELRQSLKELK